MNEALYTFISTGDKVGFYTLRVMERVTVYIEGVGHSVLKDFYIQNLSTDKAIAEDKAIQISEEMNLPFKGNADFDLNEIRRRNIEEIQRQKEVFERAIRDAVEKRQQEFQRMVTEGVFVCGKYIGKTAEEVFKMDRGYIFWCADQYVENAETSKFQINCKVAKEYIEKNNIQKPGYVGEVGQELTVKMTLKRSKWTTGQFPTIMFISETENGEEVVFFSVAKKFKELDYGNTFTVKGMVKDQREDWSGNKQTILNKPKMV